MINAKAISVKTVSPQQNVEQFFKPHTLFVLFGMAVRSPI